MPTLAQAHPLAIANHTDSSISFSVNNICSDDFGTVYENEIKTIPEDILNKACSNYASECEITGYNAKNCSGKPIGGIKYVTEHDIVVFGATDSNISITGTESSLFYISPL
jgi:hypothetical protein